MEVNDIFKIFTFPLADTENTRVAMSFPQENKNEQKKVLNEIIIVITYPKSKPDIILKLIKTFRDFFNNSIHINKLSEFSDSTDIWNYFDKQNTVLPDRILVIDYMEPVEVFLQESNNLKDAINMFIQTGYLNIPVIDIEGNLIGEVTARELMEVCLPRYILWMDDIDPIIHFEPFQNMLAQEDNTWLAEILNYNMAVVQKDEPLMKAAIQMTKKEVTHVYVLDDKKLLGIIIMRYFLNKVLRA
jgi:CBS domain-containing protein